MNRTTDVTRIGRYRVVRPLGQGGMGQVYLAEDPDLERQLAIKLLHHETARGLRDEAKALAALRHPGIVTVFEVGVHEGREFIAMEYLPGRTLRELIPEYATRRSELVAICAKVALAVAAAHRAGILHRDIKPENIIVTEDGEVKVLDFGIARREIEDRPSSATMTDLAETYARTQPPGLGDTLKSASGETISGTPSYMAPELLYGESASVASDIYSLGVVLYECLTGRRPHGGRSLVDLITNIVETPIARLDDALAEPVARMLDPQPAQRISLEQVVARLAPPLTLPRSIVAAIVLGTILSIAAVGLVTYVALARPKQRITATVAVAIELELLNTSGVSYGNKNPDALLTAQTLVRYFDNVQGPRIAGIALPGLDADVVDATHHLHGSIGYTPDGKYHARFALDDLTGENPRQTIDETDKVFGALIQNVAAKTAVAIDPRAVFNRHEEQRYARKVLDEAKRLVAEIRYHEALPLLEAAVKADPQLAEAWYYLALTRDWMIQPEDAIQEAIDAAVRATRHDESADRQAFLTGVHLYFHRSYGASRATLEPLLERLPNAAFATRDLYYFLGEANWHDGRHQAGYALFMRAIEVDPHFAPATIHAAQYCVARRDPCASYVLGLSHEPPDALDFALGKYEQLANANPIRDIGLTARLVLGQELTDLEIGGRGDHTGANHIARALAGGDVAAARRRFEIAWNDVISAHPTQNAFHSIDHLVEVVLTADGLGDESRRLVKFLAGTGTTSRKRNYARFAILAAALTRDRSLIPHDLELTERDTKLAKAVGALLDGDPAKGIAGIRALVADPTPYWEYPERALLVRELRAAGRTADAQAICADSMRPAMFRIAFIVMRGVCAAPATGRGGNRTAPAPRRRATR